MDATQTEQLSRDCQAELPDLAAQALALFNAGEYYKQHDLLEELWRMTGGPVRDLYQGILQIGVGYYQILRGNRRGARKMLRRGLRKLTPLPDVCQGVDVKTLCEDATCVQEALESLPDEQIGQFDLTLLQPVKMVDASE